MRITKRQTQSEQMLLWKNGADRFSSYTVAINLQIVKNSVFAKCN